MKPQSTSVKSLAGSGSKSTIASSYLVRTFAKNATAASIDSALQVLEGSDVIDIDDKRLSDLQEAEILIEQIIEGAITVARLTTAQRQKISFYLATFNPLISRIVSLHTKLPLSTMRIQKPKHEIDIVQDYIHAYFDKLVSSEKFKENLEDIIRNFWTVGRGLGRVEDDFHFDKDTLMDGDLSKLTLPEISQEDLERINKINSEYNRDPSSVTWAEKKSVLVHYLLQVNNEYKGVKHYRSIHPLDLKGASVNEDIDYYTYDLPIPVGIKNWGDQNATNLKTEAELNSHPLVKLGYSKGLVKLSLAGGSEGKITIDSDPYGEDGVYMTEISTSKPIIEACLESAIVNMAAIKHNNELVGMSSKIDRLISAPNASESQLAVLNSSLAEMAEAPQGSALAVNFEVNIEELSLDVKDLIDLDATIERTNKEIMSTTGMPEELITEGGTYGSGFLKVELLSHEYIEFRNRLKAFIENQIFIPLAIKNGFITVDDWGNTVPLYPSVKFDKLSLARSSEDFAQLVDLVLSNKLPVELLYESMGLEAEDIKQKLVREKGTILDESVQDAISSAFSNLADMLSESPALKVKLLEALALPVPPELLSALEATEQEQ